MSKIPGSAHLNFTLGGLTIVGGITGFVRKGSKPSLAAGIGCGSLLLGGGYLICCDKHYEGHTLAAVTSATMAGGMGQRFLKTRSFMPVGLVAVIGITGAAYNLKKAMDWAPTRDD